MAVPETAQAQKPGYLDEEQLISSRPSYAISGSGYRLASVLNSLAGCHLHHPIPLVLKLLLLTVFSGILVAILAQVFSIPSRQEYEQDQLQRKQFYKEIAQMKDTINNLCRPCSWDWTFFQGKCYFFSKSQKSWHDSITACKEEGAELVIVESAEEQSFLQQTSKSKGIMWMGLSDLNKEGTWHWVDGSPLSGSFADYWNKGEPNNVGGEDCAEFKDDGWNDSRCENANFWICKKTAKSCSQN
ncbi:CD209 antigen-like protein E isoform X1 [Cavia porcellus]|uniref:CD209 antigen-like protein E isoform X1 n=1 Tax=Cavia porcellus TaxID=10141 RepID=UPI00022B5FC9|nr:CD209 antigen-like protein E [Cavia porcellus]XP_013006401.1 CD209 antigen-like protein E [Cavia porcellus]XP_013006402.1 CD209 antigen-like protein E [Cavia porcellus]